MTQGGEEEKLFNNKNRKFHSQSLNLCSYESKNKLHSLDSAAYYRVEPLKYQSTDS